MSSQLNYFKKNAKSEKMITKFIWKNQSSGTSKKPGEKDVKEVDSAVSDIKL